MFQVKLILFVLLGFCELLRWPQKGRVSRITPTASSQTSTATIIIGQPSGNTRNFWTGGCAKKHLQIKQIHDRSLVYI